MTPFAQATAPHTRGSSEVGTAVLVLQTALIDVGAGPRWVVGGSVRHRSCGWNGPAPRRRPGRELGRRTHEKGDRPAHSVGGAVASEASITL